MKRLIVLISLVFLTSFIPSHAEDLDTVWTKKYVDLTCVKFTPDGKRILGAYGNSIFELDAITGDTIRKYEPRGVNVPIPYMQITNDGEYVYTGTSSCELYGWNTTTGKSLGRINYDKELKRTCGFCIHPTENKMYFYFKDTIALFNLDNNKFETINIIKDNFITNFAVSKDNKLIAISSSYYDNSKEIYLQKILLIDTKDFSIITELKSTSSETMAIDFSYDSKYIAYLSYEPIGFVLNVYNIELGQINHYYNGQLNFNMYSAKYIKENNLLVVSGREEIAGVSKTSILDNRNQKILYTFNYGAHNGYFDISSKDQIAIEDNGTLSLINNRWFITDVDSDTGIPKLDSISANYDGNSLQIINPLNKNIIGIKVYDMSGVELKEFSASNLNNRNSKITIPFPRSSGIYFTEIITENGSLKFKIMVGAK